MQYIIKQLFRIESWDFLIYEIDNELNNKLCNISMLWDFEKTQWEYTD